MNDSNSIFKTSHRVSIPFIENPPTKLKKRFVRKLPAVGRVSEGKKHYNKIGIKRRVGTLKTVILMMEPGITKKGLMTKIRDVFGIQLFQQFFIIWRERVHHE